MDISEVMRTSFAAREFTDDEISDEVIYRILEHARFAPSGGNRQGCHVIVIRDQNIKKSLVRPFVARTIEMLKNGSKS